MLFPALLILPVLHLHPAATRGHGAHAVHQHAAVAHADFLLSLTRDHDESHKGHGIRGDTSSQFLPQISFLTVLPRPLVFSLLTLERTLGSLSVAALVLPSPFAFHTWILTRDHAPPVQTFAFSPISPRSPPRTA